MGSLGNSISNTLGIKETRRILGDSANMYSNDDFIKALSQARLEYNDEGEIKFRFAGKDKSSGRTVLMEVSGMSKKEVLSDIRNNGYTVQRLYTIQVYDAIINHSDGEKWELLDATKIDRELLRRRR